MKLLCGKLTLSIIALFLCLVVSNNCFAQDLDDVILSGKVTDQNGAIVIGATVTAVLTEKGIERSVTTDENGRYRIIELQPGKYSIRVNSAGFGILTKTDLDTISGQSINVDFSLVPENIRAEQTVSFDDTDAPVIDPNRTIVGGTITQREIEELPNNSRNPFDLVLTLGGTAEEALSTRDLADDRNVVSATAPAEQGNFPYRHSYFAYKLFILRTNLSFSDFYTSHKLKHL